MPNRSNDARARLEGLARRYYGPLASFFRKRARNSEEVQDLVQQVFLRLAQSRQFDEIRNPEGYTLFNGAPEAAPTGMTDWDQSFLKALYATDQKSKQQRGQIARSMVREIAP
jgi:hypothetical protein